MKTVFIFLFCGYMLSANQLIAQKQQNKLLPVVTITAGSNVSTRMNKAFNSKFKHAENMRWFQINQNYLVKFIMEDMEHHAAFNKNGYLVYHISYGVEKNLPPAIRMMVKSSYDEYDIGTVFNVDRKGQNVWIVNLESRKYFVIASIENDAIKEITRYKNATASNPIISKAY